MKPVPGEDLTLQMPIPFKMRTGSKVKAYRSAGSEVVRATVAMSPEEHQLLVQVAALRHETHGSVIARLIREELEIIEREQEETPQV